ncbi:MAG: AAA family ATPase [Alphaproteobacteria bacterium]
MDQSKVIRQPAEQRYADELEALRNGDVTARPPGWKLSPRRIRTFICGSDGQEIDGQIISRKFYGDDALIERAIVSLMGNRALMLVGEPGTAKSMISELLAAAISGTSTLTIQGTAATTEDHIKYSWNYALLLAEGASERALVPSPLYTGMQTGQIVRFEEVTRCPAEIQDIMISILSEKLMMVPELGDGAMAMAQPGFNVIATANLRDRGVHEMSSALKRRMNFETVRPLSDPYYERELVQNEVTRLLAESQISADLPPDLVDALVTTFQDLRRGATADGTVIDRPSTVMSTAEVVAVAHGAALDAVWFGDGQVTGQQVMRQLQGAALQDNADDAKRLRQYVETIIRPRAGTSSGFAALYDARHELRL